MRKIHDWMKITKIFPSTVLLYAVYAKCSREHWSDFNSMCLHYAGIMCLPNIMLIIELAYLTQAKYSHSQVTACCDVWILSSLLGQITFDILTAVAV